MFSDTVTLFNRFDGGGRVLWLPSKIGGVYLCASRAVTAGYGAGADSAVELHVPIGEPYDGVRTVGGKLWLPPLTWRSQTEAEAAKTLTFVCGEKFDFFITGTWDGDGPVDDGAYRADGGFYGYLKRTRDGVYAVTSVEGPFSLIPHFEITGM